MRTISEKYANISKYYIDVTVFFWEKNDYLPERFPIVRDCSTVSIVNNRKKNIRLNMLTKTKSNPGNKQIRNNVLAQYPQISIDTV